MLQQGGPFIPGTVNDFGGNSKSEYGDLLFVDYRVRGFTARHPRAGLPPRAAGEPLRGVADG